MASFTDQLKEQTSNIIIKIKTLPTTIKNMPQEYLIAYGLITLGLIFILVALILW
jgi:flagellar biosynthesis/type III secretory pathway M-ring protein FliF/YscJ